MGLDEAQFGESDRVGGRLLSENNDVVSIVDERPRGHKSKHHNVYNNLQSAGYQSNLKGNLKSSQNNFFSVDNRSDD